MSYFDRVPKYYIGQKYQAAFVDGFEEKLKSVGKLHKVIARIKRICDSGHFGILPEGYKYFGKENLGWLKWKDGTRVYFSKFEGFIVVFLVSGNKNSQKGDIRVAKELKNEIEKAIEEYEKT